MNVFLYIDEYLIKVRVIQKNKNKQKTTITATTIKHRLTYLETIKKKNPQPYKNK